MDERVFNEVCQWARNYNSSYGGTHPGIRQIYFGQGDFFHIHEKTFFIVSSYSHFLEERITDIDLKIAREFPREDYEFQLFPFEEERLKREKLELIIDLLANNNDSKGKTEIPDKKYLHLSKVIQH